MAKKQKKLKEAVKKPETALIVSKPTEMSPQNLISQAITQGVSVETMGKLMDLQDRWEEKKAKKAFDEAMAEFQVECPIIKKKTAVKDKFGEVLYYYAKIESIVEQVRPFIQKNGFSYRIITGERNKMLFADCIVKHKLGHTETTPFEVPLGAGTSIMSAPQKQAASLTFAKRYAFCNAFGIMTGDDDTDANDTDKNEGKIPPKKTDKKDVFEMTVKAIENENNDEKLKQLGNRIVADKKVFTEAQKDKLIRYVEKKLGIKVS